MLSRRCNEIADKAGAKTYVVGRPNSLRMLHKTGFRAVAADHIDMIKYGGSKEDGKMWILVREPGDSGSSTFHDSDREESHVPSVSDILKAREEQRWKDIMSSDSCQAFWAACDRYENR